MLVKWMDIVESRKKDLDLKLLTEKRLGDEE